MYRNLFFCSLVPKPVFSTIQDMKNYLTHKSYKHNIFSHLFFNYITMYKKRFILDGNCINKYISSVLPINKLIFKSLIQNNNTRKFKTCTNYKYFNLNQILHNLHL